MRPFTLALFIGALVATDVVANEPPAEPTPETVTTANEAVSDPSTSNETAAETVSEVETQVQPVQTQVAVTPYTNYVTEQLYIFVHAGSSTRYRIIGRILSGEAVTVVGKDNETGWLEVRYDNDKTGWVNDDNLVAEPGLKQALVKAEQTIKEQATRIDKLSSINSDDVDELKAQLEQAQQQNTQLAEKLLLASQDNQKLQAAVKQADETKRILAKLYDVGGVLLGVFFGWLLTRRKRSQWV